MAASSIWLPSAIRSTTQTSPDIDVGGFRHVTVTVDITLIGTGSITLTINGKDLASGKYRLLLASAALVATATTILRVTEFLTAAVNSIALDVLPEFIQFVVTANNANPVTYSVGYDLSN